MESMPATATTALRRHLVSFARYYPLYYREVSLEKLAEYLQGTSLRLNSHCFAEVHVGLDNSMLVRLYSSGPLSPELVTPPMPLPS